MAAFLGGFTQGLARGIERNRRNKLALEDLKLKQQRIKLEEKEQQVKLDAFAQRERDVEGFKNFGLGLLGIPAKNAVGTAAPATGITPSKPPQPTLRNFREGSVANTPLSPSISATVDVRGQQNLVGFGGKGFETPSTTQPATRRQPPSVGLSPERKAVFKRALETVSDPKMAQFIVKQLQTEMAAANKVKEGFVLKPGDVKFNDQFEVIARGDRKVQSSSEEVFENPLTGEVIKWTTVLYTDGSTEQFKTRAARTFKEVKLKNELGGETVVLMDQFGNRSPFVKTSGPDKTKIEFMKQTDNQGNPIIFAVSSRSTPEGDVYFSTHRLPGLGDPDDIAKPLETFHYADTKSGLMRSFVLDPTSGVSELQTTAKIGKVQKATATKDIELLGMLETMFPTKFQSLTMQMDGQIPTLDDMFGFFDPKDMLAATRQILKNKVTDEAEADAQALLKTVGATVKAKKKAELEATLDFTIAERDAIEKRSHFYIDRKGNFADRHVPTRELKALGFIEISQAQMDSVANAKSALEQLKEYARAVETLLPDVGEFIDAPEGLKDLVTNAFIGIMNIGLLQWNKTKLAALRLGGDAAAQQFEGLFGAIATIARATGDTANIAVAERRLLKTFVPSSGASKQSGRALIAQATRILQGNIFNRGIPVERLSEKEKAGEVDALGARIKDTIWKGGTGPQVKGQQANTLQGQVDNLGKEQKRTINDAVDEFEAGTIGIGKLRKRFKSVWPSFGEEYTDAYLRVKREQDAKK